MPFPTGFDIDDPADLLKLKQEQLGTFDAVSAIMGYDTVISSVSKSLKLINLPENNAEDPTPVIGQLTVADLFTAIDPDDLDAQQVDDGKLVYLQGLMNRGFFEDVSSYLPQLKAIFSSGAATTLSNLNAALRDQARYEVLFGVFTLKISSTDWRTARDS